MGFYIEVPKDFNKARQLQQLHKGTIVEREDALRAVSNPKVGVIVVVRNPTFEAALFVFNSFEWERAHDPRDLRHRQYVLLDRAVAEQLSGFTP